MSQNFRFSDLPVELQERVLNQLVRPWTLTLSDMFYKPQDWSLSWGDFVLDSRTSSIKSVRQALRTGGIDISIRHHEHDTPSEVSREFDDILNCFHVSPRVRELAEQQLLAEFQGRVQIPTSLDHLKNSLLPRRLVPLRQSIANLIRLIEDRPRHQAHLEQLKKTFPNLGTIYMRFHEDDHLLQAQNQFHALFNTYGNLSVLSGSHDESILKMAGKTLTNNLDLPAVGLTTCCRLEYQVPNPGKKRFHKNARSSLVEPDWDVHCPYDFPGNFYQYWLETDGISIWIMKKLMSKDVRFEAYYKNRPRLYPGGSHALPFPVVEDLDSTWKWQIFEFHTSDVFQHLRGIRPTD